MSTGYWWASAVLIVLFVFVALASHFGWGLTSDAQAMAHSVRAGSLHTRHFYGGGPGFGK